MYAAMYEMTWQCASIDGAAYGVEKTHVILIRKPGRMNHLNGSDTTTATTAAAPPTAAQANQIQ